MRTRCSGAAVTPPAGHCCCLKLGVAAVAALMRPSPTWQPHRPVVALAATAEPPHTAASLQCGPGPGQPALLRPHPGAGQAGRHHCRTLKKAADRLLSHWLSFLLLGVPADRAAAAALSDVGIIITSRLPRLDIHQRNPSLLTCCSTFTLLTVLQKSVFQLTQPRIFCLSARIPEYKQRISSLQ